MLTSQLLIDGLSFGFTQRYLAGSELLRYWISPDTPVALARQLERVLLRLDALLDVDLQRTADPAQATVQIVPGSGQREVDPVTGIATLVIGEAIPGDQRWRVAWAPQGAGDLETLVHELGHVLGLGHPNRTNPRDDRYSSATTVMSYNRDPASPGRFYTATDLDALTGLWGRENDPAALQPSWVSPDSRLDSGTSLAAGLQSALGQPDPAAFIDAAYWLSLGRAADAGGLGFWQQQLGAGLARRQLVDALLLSDEAAQLLA